MAVNLDNYELTEEQRAELTSAINSELDRARTQASQTARKNAEKSFNDSMPSIVQEAIEKAKAEESKTAEQRAAEEWQTKYDQLNETLKAAEIDRNRYNNEAAIRKSGITDDTMVTTFAKMFENEPENLQGFLTAFNDSVQNQVKSAKQEFMNNATPPSGSLNANQQPTSGTANISAVSELVTSNVAENGGTLDDAALFAQVRNMQQQ